MSFLDFEGKNFLVLGVANKKSVATFVSKIIEEEGGNLFLSVKTKERKETALKLFPSAKVFICDVEKEDDINDLYEGVKANAHTIHGIVHSIAFANFSEGLKPFHETKKNDFMQALDISCFSLISICNRFKDMLDKQASVVTISISTTRMASENYGYMAPIKAALDSTLVFLAKSFSAFSEVRFNSVGSGLLKTSASAGIPGYVDSYLYAGQTTLRKRAIDTKETANGVAFLLSQASSGITTQKLVIDGGMETNYFNKEAVEKVTRK